MPSLSSDGVETVRVAIESAGALDRPKLVVPEGTMPEGLVRIEADESTYHAPVEVGLDGEYELRGLYDNARLAREGGGENRLTEWVESAGLEAGRSALLDVVVEGEQYGLRAPGERAVYDVAETPDDSGGPRRMTDDDRPASALYDAFLEGERADDILVYLHEEGVGAMGELLEIGTRVDDGVVLVLPGKEGRSAFQQATGLDAMDFAGMAMQTDGDIDADCTGGTCPDAEDKPEEDHYVKFVFGFAEEQNEGVGGIYAEGDVIHGYAACACGTTYSDKWVVEE